MYPERFSIDCTYIFSIYGFVVVDVVSCFVCLRFVCESFLVETCFIVLFLLFFIFLRR